MGSGKEIITLSIDAATVDEFRLILDEKHLRYSGVIQDFMREYIEKNRK